MAWRPEFGNGVFTATQGQGREDLLLRPLCGAIFAGLLGFEYENF
jgi:hypothetical protein